MKSKTEFPILISFIICGLAIVTLCKAEEIISFYSKYETCIENSRPIGDGHHIGFCGGEKTSYGDETIVYDTSGLIAAPPSRRTALWRYAFLRDHFGLKDNTILATKLAGSFYQLSIADESHSDDDLTEFAKSFGCAEHFTAKELETRTPEFSCSGFKPTSSSTKSQ